MVALDRKVAGTPKAFRFEAWRAPLGYLLCLALTGALMAAWSCVKAQPGPRDRLSDMTQVEDRSFDPELVFQ